MWIIILIIVLILIGFALAIPLAGLVVFSQAQAKKEAKKILAAGTINNPRKFKQTMNVLSHTTNDLEAADLWKKLQTLSEQNTQRTA